MADSHPIRVLWGAAARVSADIDVSAARNPVQGITPPWRRDGDQPDFFRITVQDHAESFGAFDGTANSPIIGCAARLAYAIPNPEHYKTMASEDADKARQAQRAADVIVWRREGNFLYLDFPNADFGGDWQANIAHNISGQGVNVAQLSITAFPIARLFAPSGEGKIRYSLLPQDDATDLGAAESRWRNIFLSGVLDFAGAIVQPPAPGTPTVLRLPSGGTEAAPVQIASKADINADSIFQPHPISAAAAYPLTGGAQGDAIRIMEFPAAAAPGAFAIYSPFAAALAAIFDGAGGIPDFLNPAHAQYIAADTAAANPGNIKKQGDEEQTTINLTGGTSITFRNMEAMLLSTGDTTGFLLTGQITGTDLENFTSRVITGKTFALPDAPANTVLAQNVLAKNVGADGVVARQATFHTLRRIAPDGNTFPVIRPVHISDSPPNPWDNAAQGFGVGSRWLTANGKNEWICTAIADADGAATWLRTRGSVLIWESGPNELIELPAPNWDYEDETSDADDEARLKLPIISIPLTSPRRFQWTDFSAFAFQLGGGHTRTIPIAAFPNGGTIREENRIEADHATRGFGWSITRSGASGFSVNKDQGRDFQNSVNSTQNNLAKMWGIF